MGVCAAPTHGVLAWRMANEESPKLPADVPQLPDVGRVDAWASMVERVWGGLNLLGVTGALWWEKLMPSAPDLYIGWAAIFFLVTLLLSIWRHCANNKRAVALAAYQRQLEGWAAKRVADAEGVTAGAVAAARKEEQEKASVLRTQDGRTLTNKDSQLQTAYTEWASRMAEKNREIVELTRQLEQKTETIAKLSSLRAPPKPAGPGSAEK